MSERGNCTVCGFNTNYKFEGLFFCSPHCRTEFVQKDGFPIGRPPYAGATGRYWEGDKEEVPVGLSPLRHDYYPCKMCGRKKTHSNVVSLGAGEWACRVKCYPEAQSGGYIMQLLQQLKGVQVDGLQLDEAVALLSFADQMKATYEATVDEVPQWLVDTRALLEKEVRSRAEDALQRRLKELETQEDRLKSAEEKRKDIAAEKQRLLAKLGKGTPAG